MDNVCQSIACELFFKCRDQLGSVLKHELRVTEADGKSDCTVFPPCHRLAYTSKAHEHCALLLAVDPQDEQERRQLRKEQEKLRKAQSWLENLTLAAEDGLNV